LNEQRILEELLSLLEKNGILLRSEPLGGRGGGLCKLKGQTIFFVDTQATSAEMAAICAEAVSKLINTETIYIRPEIRQFIETHSGQI
jgi:hypothetical protein